MHCREREREMFLCSSCNFFFCVWRLAGGRQIREPWEREREREIFSAAQTFFPMVAATAAQIVFSSSFFSSRSIASSPHLAMPRRRRRRRRKKLHFEYGRRRSLVVSHGCGRNVLRIILPNLSGLHISFLFANCLQLTVSSR